jgi:hypothetical protein
LLTSTIASQRRPGGWPTRPSGRPVHFTNKVTYGRAAHPCEWGRSRAIRAMFRQWSARRVILWRWP